MLHRSVLAALSAIHLLLAGDPLLAGELPEACRTDCVSPYGTLLGETEDGVKAWSNCRSECVIFEPANHGGRYTGIKWQCVEFARRWLLINRGAVYGDVDIAADIWDSVDHLTDVQWDEEIPLENHANGSAVAPAVGDLLIYAKQFHGTGHVAVVTDVDLDKGVVEVAEQNFNNEKWGGDHARRIELVQTGGHYRLHDAHLIGWKTIRDQD